jgi:hypothetical protein
MWSLLRTEVRAPISWGIYLTCWHPISELIWTADQEEEEPNFEASESYKSIQPLPAYGGVAGPEVAGRS